MKTQYVWAVLEMPAMSQQQILQAQYKFSKPYLAKKNQQKNVFWEVQQFTKIGQPRRKKQQRLNILTCHIKNIMEIRSPSLL